MINQERRCNDLTWMNESLNFILFNLTANTQYESIGDLFIIYSFTYLIWLLQKCNIWPYMKAYILNNRIYVRTYWCSACDVINVPATPAYGKLVNQINKFQWDVSNIWLISVRYEKSEKLLLVCVLSWMLYKCYI